MTILNKALTRPATLGGIPLVPLIFVYGAIALIAVYINYWLLLLLVPATIEMRSKARKDLFYFDLKYLSFKTRGKRAANQFYNANVVTANQYDSIDIKEFIEHMRLNESVTLSKYIPYSSHIHENVVKNKNGDLVSTWELGGLIFECEDDDYINQMTAQVNKLRLTQDTAFDNLVLSAGNVIFEGNNQFLDLNVKSLSGSGQFFMNSAISAHDSDFITAEQGSGRFGILMKDSGLTPDSEYDLNIAHIGQGDAKFHLTNDKGLVDLGVYKYALTQTGNDWYLTPTSWLSTGSEAIVSVVDGNNKLTTESVNRVQSRLMIANAGERDNNLGANTHLWLDYDNSRLNHLRSESQYWLLNNAVTMGVDTVFSFDSGATNVFGGYVGYGQSSQRFKNINGHNDIRHTTLGIYDTYRYGQYWLSGIGQFSYLKNDVRFNTETAQSTAKFNSQYYTGSVHAGVDFTTANLTTTPYGGLMLNMGSPNDFRRIFGKARPRRGKSPC
ncbi:pertactin-like passenger domain-containing protein [Providencia alcalifaciens]|uniref:pertactin-like passenger domain-containing protein n=1 Tax=Providencia alcalifaciens TaxID=126385 RepID=UPI00029BA8AE|nr:conjugal transfer protein [Providencia alcalifaciens Dmel2]